MMEERRKPEISFHRDMRQNYLMIASDEETERRYETRMLAGNTIDGLLRFRIRREDNRLWFCYEITSRQPLTRLVERTGITALQLRRLLLGIAQTLVRMEDYLLEENLILLDPEYIYVDPEDFRPGLCLVPGWECDFPREFSRFLQFLLGKTDHRDKEAVMLIYGLYQESLKDSYGLNDLMRWLMKESRPDEGSSNTDDSVVEMEHGIPEKNLETAGTKTDNVWAEEGQYWKVQENIRRRTPATLYSLIVWGLIPILTAVALWMWRGMSGVVRYGVPVLGIATVAAAVGIVSSIWKTIRRNRMDLPGKPEIRHGTVGTKYVASEIKRGTAETKSVISRMETGAEEIKPEKGNRRQAWPETWEMVFSEDGYEVGSYEEEGEDMGETGGRLSPDDQTHTVLLKPAAPRTDLRRFVGISGTTETIPVSYYPFLIGKQENLADFILQKETISRLHVRIDRKNDTYWLTDLNSTNGTMVNGRLLDANETVELTLGDMVDLADLHFQFE